MARLSLVDFKTDGEKIQKMLDRTGRIFMSVWKAF